MRKLRLTVDATRTAGAIRDEVLKRSEVSRPQCTALLDWRSRRGAPDCWGGAAALRGRA